MKRVTDLRMRRKSCRVSYGVDEAAEGLENKLNVGEVPMTYVKERKVCRMSCATSQLILQPFNQSINQSINIYLP